MSSEPSPPRRFRDRRDAGRRLAARLEDFAGREDVVLVALPRGGVPVAYEVARALAVPVDVCVVRKLGLPGHEEHELGAMTLSGTPGLSIDLARRFGVSEAAVRAVFEREARRLAECEARYRAGRPALELEDRVVILVDDGLATGAALRAALREVRRRAPREVVIAVPVADAENARVLAEQVDALVTLKPLERLGAVSLWYVDFEQVSEDEAIALVARARDERASVN